MIINKSSLLLIIGILLLGGCTNYEKEQEKLNSFLEGQNIISSDGGNKKVYYLLPLKGCGYCIINSLKFMEGQLNNDDLKFIISNVVGLKTTRLRIGKELFSHRSILIDGDNELVKNRLVSSYPTVFYLENEKITKVQTLNARNIDAEFHEILSFFNR